MSPRLRTFLAQVGSFILAGVLLYFALRGVDFAEVGRALTHADYAWLLPLVGIVIVSHWLRAWRWKILLDALPPEPPGGPPRNTSLGTSFSALMIGYMVNYAAPRLGEFARSVNLASREKLSFSSVFGTVVVERILDVVVLLLALILTGFLLMDQLVTINELFFAPLTERAGGIPLIGLLGLTTGILVLLFFMFRRALKTESFVGRMWTSRVRPVMVSFRDGMLTVLRSRRRFAIAFSTVAMWLCYVVMAHLPFVILNMAEPYELSLLDSWVIMVVGALGIAVPSPGGTGSYHYIVIQTLVHLFGVEQTDAATYAVLSHAAQLVLYTLLGFTCLLIQGSSLRALTSTARSAGSKHAPGPSAPAVRQAPAVEVDKTA